MLNTRFSRVEVESGGTYAAGGTARIPLAQLGAQSKTGFDGQHTRIAALIVSASQVVANASGGTISLAHQKAHDFVRRVFVGGKWRYFDFPFYGGQQLRIMRKLFGRNAEHRTDESINNSASSTGQKYRYVLPFIDPRMRKPTDFAPMARSLKDVIMELTFCNGAAGNEWGSGISTSSGSIDEVVAVLVDVDHFTKEVKHTWFEKKLASLNDSTSIPPGRKYSDLHIVPAQSPSGGYAATSLSTSDVTKIEYTEDTDQIGRNLKPQSLVSAFNLDVLDDDAELPRYELGGANEFLPVKWPSRSRREGLTRGAIAGGNPTLNITGSLSTSNTYLLMRSLEPTTEDDLVESMVMAGIRPSGDFLANVGKRKFAKAKSESKTTVREDKAVWLPQTLVPKGVK